MSDTGTQSPLPDGAAFQEQLNDLAWQLEAALAERDRLADAIKRYITHRSGNDFAHMVAIYDDWKARPQ